MKDRLFFGNILSAVEYSFDSDGNEIYIHLQLEKKKQKLEIKDSRRFFNQDELLQFLKESSIRHTILVLNNKQVLSKSIETKNELEEIIFKRAFPSLPSKEFYKRILPTNTGTYLSVVRESYVASVIKEFANININVLDVLLGNTAFSSLVSIIENGEISTSNTKLTLANSAVTSVATKKFTNEDYKINGLQINNQYILSLSAIVYFYLNKEVSYKQEYFTAYLEKKKFNLGYKIILGIIFFLVLLNFIYFNNYNTEVNRLTQQLEIKKDGKRKLIDLKSNVKKKRKLLSELQNSSAFSVAKYSDQIVSEIPKSILLSELIYQPLNRVLKKGKETSFKIKEIEVKGVFNNYIEFTSWIDNLEKKDWVKQLLELTTEKAKRKKNSNFHILILIE
ncbi:hypothetical protein [Tenacibaculum jejuense]|uniref:Uncharacterized protein n=1 Tax=Tenacibaculum jejuense TaxID=584609 RepID=A0A238U8Y3_9FLAO|nr:hypothetical protein [Tenacibaculum jejuense]SNR15456.1 conserved protein of unknown function [Tenacibaculum jejuense]